MSLVFIDGFDHYASGDELLKWDAPGNNPANYSTPSIETGRDNRGKAVKTNVGHWLKYVPAQDTYIVGFAFKFSDGSADGDPLMSFRCGYSEQLTLRLTAAAKIQAYREDSSPVALGTPTRVLVSGTWYYIECKLKVHNTTGSVEVRIDGLMDSIAEAVDTRATTTQEFPAYIDGISIGCAGGIYVYYWFDDLYICDTGGGRNNDFLGVCRVDLLVPTANGATNNWAASSGSNYSCVDELTASMNDYVQSNAVNDVDLYVYGDLPFSPEAINGVQTTVYAKRANASFRKLAAATRLEGVNYAETGRWLATSPRYYTHINETQPSGTGVWTKAAVDAAQFGVKVLA